MATITHNFHYKGKWYFPGDEIKGAAATAARKAGCVRETKMQSGAPENKSTQEDS